jgi:hypothetical protein
MSQIGVQPSSTIDDGLITARLARRYYPVCWSLQDVVVEGQMQGAGALDNETISEVGGAQISKHKLSFGVVC